MARNSMGKLLKWGAIGAVALYGYGYVSKHGLPGIGTASATASGSAGGTASGGHGCSFIAGTQYVSPLPNGQFEVVIGGKQVYVSNSQSDAERKYNQILGC